MFNSLPQTMKASVVQGDKTVAVENKPLPVVGARDILLRVLVVGQNPTDWKHAAWLSDRGDIIGCDFVGEVVQIGNLVPKDSVSVGEIRSGFMRGGKSPNRGAFAEYVTQEADLTFVVKNISPHQAASALPLFTAAQALYLRIGIPRPGEDNSKFAGKWFLVWSGSTAVGQYAIQLAKLVGMRVATTCSPRRNELVKRLGAEVIVDYNDPSVSEKLFKATEGGIIFGLDSYTEGGSTAKAQLAFSKSGGIMPLVGLFTPSDLVRDNVKSDYTMVYTSLGEDGDFGPGSLFRTTSPEDRAQLVKSATMVTELFADGRLVPLEHTDLGGLENVQRGFEMMIKNQHTDKLVYTVGV